MKLFILQCSEHIASATWNEIIHFTAINKLVSYSACASPKKKGTNTLNRVCPALSDKYDVISLHRI